MVKRSEATGINALRNFAMQVRGYALRTPPWLNKSVEVKPAKFFFFRHPREREEIHFKNGFFVTWVEPAKPN